jgi:hypothetical protein
LYSKTAESLQVRVGEWDTQTTSELYPHEEIDVEKVFPKNQNYCLKNHASFSR